MANDFLAVANLIILILETTLAPRITCEADKMPISGSDEKQVLEFFKNIYAQS